MSDTNLLEYPEFYDSFKNSNSAPHRLIPPGDIIAGLTAHFSKNNIAVDSIQLDTQYTTACINGVKYKYYAEQQTADEDGKVIYPWYGMYYSTYQKLLPDNTQVILLFRELDMSTFYSVQLDLSVFYNGGKKKYLSFTPQTDANGNREYRCGNIIMTVLP